MWLKWTYSQIWTFMNETLNIIMLFVSKSKCFQKQPGWWLGNWNRFLVNGPQKKASGAPAYRWNKLLKIGLNCKCHQHSSVLYAFAAVIKKKDWRWAGWLCKIPDSKKSRCIERWKGITQTPCLNSNFTFALWEVMFGVGYWLLIKKVSARPGKGPKEEDNAGTGRSRVHVALHTDATPTRGQRTRPQWSHYMPCNDGGAC